MRAPEFIRGHVIFKLHYDQIYQMKTTLISCCTFLKTFPKLSDFYIFHEYPFGPLNIFYIIPAQQRVRFYSEKYVFLYAWENTMLHSVS